MYHWIEDKNFLRRAYSDCSDIVNQLVQKLKNYEIRSRMKIVGSKSRNMVTQNASQAIDFDFNLLIENANDYHNAKDLKEEVRKAFNEVLSRNGWGDFQDSTSALATRCRHFTKGNRTEFYIDVCIVKQDQNGLHRLIHEKTGCTRYDRYFWNLVSNSREISEKEKVLKPDYWPEVRETYLNKKNMYLQRSDCDHPSFICYIEAVNEVYEKVRRSVN